MKPYEIRFTKVAAKDVKKLSPHLKKKLKDILLNVIASEPGTGKRLVGELADFYSLRLSYQDRIVYSINEQKRRVFIHRARTHYGE